MSFIVKEAETNLLTGSESGQQKFELVLVLIFGKTFYCDLVEKAIISDSQIKTTVNFLPLV